MTMKEPILTDPLAGLAEAHSRLVENMPEDLYHSCPYASASKLHAMARSPAHCLALMLQPLDTDALALGSAVHHRILQPSTFDQRWMIGPQVDLRTKTGKEEWAGAEIAAARANRRLIRLKDPEQVEAMQRAVAAHPSAGPLLAALTQVEYSGFWRDRRTGLPCRMRLDGWCPSLAGGGTIIDLKTTTDASPAGFGRSAYTYGYWRQAAMYMDGAAACGLRARHYVIVAIEKEPPYAVGCYRVPDSLIETGRASIDLLMDQYATCLRDDRWPGYSDEVEDLELPGWAQHQFEAEGLVIQ